jgi:regulator of sigma E protease
MEIFADAARYALPFLAVLTVLVFVHELGHYLVARWCGVRVDVFSVGFGRELIGRTDARGTRWKISWIPFGGYVKFFGDAGVSSQPDLATGMTEEERQECFHFKPLGSRAAVVAAGPIANFLFAIVVFAGMYVFVGQPYTPAIVGFVEPDSAADQAGFQVGDHITEINGEAIERFEEIQAIVRLSLDRHLTVRADRGGAPVELMVRPKVVVQKDRFGNETRIGRLGIGVRGRDFIQHDPLSAIWQATRQTLFVTTATLDALGQMIVGARSADELRGPLGIAQLSGQVASVGLVSVIQFMAFLSISLGLINLFPIPMLDGGHLLFYGIEAVRGRPLGERSQEYGFRIGLALVVTLMLFATWNDLVQLRVVAFMVDLFS